jgi:adenylate cyclase
MSGPPYAVRIPGHRIDLHGRRLLRDDGGEVELRPQALDLLCELAARAGDVVGKRELFDRVWTGLVVTDDSLVQAVGDIRRAIGDERHAVVQTVPRRGYRLIALSDDAAATTPALPASAHDPPPPASRPRARRPAALLLALLATLGAVAAWWAAAGGAPAVRAPAPDRPPIAVLDFADPTTPPDDQLLARAYAEELVGELSRNADLRVIAATSSLSVDRGLPPEAIGQKLRAAYLVSGSVRREGEQLRLLARLVEATDGRVVWTERQDIAAPGVYAQRDALVRRIAGTLHATMVGNEEARALRRPPGSLDVYATALRALALKHRFTPADNAEARRLLERVVELDPGYAPGWVYLGMVNSTDYILQFSGPPRREMLVQAIEQLERGVALDPSLSAGYFGLTFTYSSAGRGADAIDAGRRCVALAPSDSECAMYLAFHLMFAGAVDEAHAHMQRGIAMNPQPPAYIRNVQGNVLWAVGRLDEAAEVFAACLRRSPGFMPCRAWRVLTLAEAGRVDEALAELPELRRRFHGASMEAWIGERWMDGGRPLMERRLAAWRRVVAAEQGAAR